MEKPNPIIPDNPIITLFVVSEGEGNNLWIPYPANPPRRPKGSSYKRYAQANKPAVAATAVISNKAKIELPTMPLIIKLFIVLSLTEAIGVFCYFFSIFHYFILRWNSNTFSIVRNLSLVGNLYQN